MKELIHLHFIVFIILQTNTLKVKAFEKQFISNEKLTKNVA